VQHVFLARFFVPSLAVLLVLTIHSRARAHALGAECKLNGKQVEVEAYYDDDTAARDAKVRVEDAAKRSVAEGVTDKAGRWSFPRPQTGRYLVVVDAGAGHRTQVRITVPPTGAASVSASVTSPDDCSCCDASPSSSDAATISEGPPRDEFTRFPWLKLGIGLAVIGVLGVAFFVSWRMRTVRRGAEPTQLT
jgi:hypothetical protein